MLSQQHIAVPRCQPVLLLQGPVLLPLSALLCNLLYVLEQLHSNPHLLIATLGSVVSLFPCPGQVLELAPVLGSGTQLLADSHLVAIPVRYFQPSEVPSQPVLLAMASSGCALVKAPTRIEPCSSVHPTNSLKPE